MSPGDRTGPRVALIDAPAARELAAGLTAAGHRAEVVGAPRLAQADSLLSRRGFTVPLSHVPLVVARLVAGRFDVVHAFTVPDAAAALAWGRLTGRPVVFTCVEVLDRSRLADRRLRRQLLCAATARSHAILAASEPARAALERWLMVDAPVVDPGDAAAHARLYGTLR